MEKNQQTSMNGQNPSSMTRLDAAVLCFVRRRSGVEQPVGVQQVKDRYGLVPRYWTPDPVLEHRACCDAIPVARGGQKRHCSGIEHIAALYAIDPAQLRAHLDATRERLDQEKWNKRLAKIAENRNA